MKYFLLASIILTASLYIYSQTPVPSNSSEHLSKTEELAIRQVQSDIQQVNQEMVSVLSDVQKDHPGYTFDFRTNTLNKIQQPPTPAPSSPAKTAPPTTEKSATPTAKK